MNYPKHVLILLLLLKLSLSQKHLNEATIRYLKKNTTTPPTPPPPTPPPEEPPSPEEEPPVEEESNGREHLEINCTSDSLTPFESQRCEEGFLWMLYNSDAVTSTFLSVAVLLIASILLYIVCNKHMHKITVVKRRRKKRVKKGFI